MTDITIIGAGAAGIAAAITAARAGKTVILIEHKDKIGKKILATGNGKCNFTNQNMSIDCFNGSKELANSILQQFSMEDCLSWFEEIGIYPKNKNGYYYPFSETAVSVVNGFEMELKNLGVEVRTGSILKDIYETKAGFDVILQNSRIQTKKLIFACGLLANPKLGSDGSAFDFIKQFGHRFVPILPSLCAFKCDGIDFKKVAGVRTNAKVTLFVNGVENCSDTGELQLTDYGLSGIPVFQISSKTSRALYEKQECIIRVDFLPDLTSDKLREFLAQRAENLTDERNVYEYLNSMFNNKLISVIIEQSKIDGKRIARTLDVTDIEGLVNVIKSTECRVKEARDFEFAQVCSGGIRTEEIDVSTLESKLVKNLYFCGELLDVDGKCGGYNLQWAWSSGVVAGQNASKRINHDKN